VTGRYPSLDEIQDIKRKRLKLSVRIRDFHITACRLMGGVAFSAALGAADEFNVDGYVSDEVHRAEDLALKVTLSAVENSILVFPSSLAGNPTAIVVDLHGCECRMHRAKANDTLAHVHESLSGLSYQYINKVRQSITTKEHLKAFDGIKLLRKEVSFHQQVYNRNSRALAKLDPELRHRYPILRKVDCSINMAVTDVNARGQSQVRLPWLWAAQDGWDGEDLAAQNSMLDNNRVLECRYSVDSKPGIWN
jgi:hypothetical protein